MYCIQCRPLSIVLLYKAERERENFGQKNQIMLIRLNKKKALKYTGMYQIDCSAKCDCLCPFVPVFVLLS